MIYFLFISILLSGWAEVWQRDLRAAYGQDRLSPLAAARLVPNRLAAVVPFSSFPPHSSVGGSDVASCCLPILFLFVYFPPVSYLYFFTKKKTQDDIAPRGVRRTLDIYLFMKGDDHKKFIPLFRLFFHFLTCWLNEDERRRSLYRR